MATFYTFGEKNENDCKQKLEPLTAEMLEGLTGSTRANILGVRVFPIVQRIYPMSAGKITGMLIQLSNKELLEMLQEDHKVLAKAHEAIDLLQNHLAKKLNPGSSVIVGKEKSD